MLALLMGGIHELRPDIHTKFHYDWVIHSKVDKGDTHTDIHRRQDDLISLLLFLFKLRKLG
jgi:hypothetical protein